MLSVTFFMGMLNIILLSFLLSFIVLIVVMLNVVPPMHIYQCVHLGDEYSSSISADCNSQVVKGEMVKEKHWIF
jgi:hypothetical protein